MNNILYLSCHAVLEYLEVKLFHELGYKVFSPGAYFNPENPGETMRPGIKGLVYDPDIVQQWHNLCAQHPGEDGKYYLTKEIVDKFDAIVVMHVPEWIINNWEAIKHKRVIWRTIGQSIASVEEKLKPYKGQGLEVVRYSPMEASIPNFIGQDALIRFYGDPEEYNNWNGNNDQVITFAQSMKGRGPACNYEIFEKATRPFRRLLFGPGNEDAGTKLCGGRVSYDRQKAEMRNNRVYFYTGTHPASYTLNFIEAFMTGIPIVAIGPKRGNADYFAGHNLYEIPDLITNQVSGFISDSVQELRNYIDLLMRDHGVAKVISKNARRAAIHHFGKDMIGAAWKAYLG